MSIILPGPCEMEGTGRTMTDLAVSEIDLTAERHRARVGVGYGLLAFGAWGVFPVYFKAVASVPTLQVLAHRIVWSLLLLVVLLVLKGRLRTVAGILRDRRTCITLLATTVLIATNWLIFIWSVANGHLLQASLGYFVNPLVSVLLGFVFLRERLTRWQLVSVGLATAGMVARAGEGLPWIALVLALTFAFYGLLRKTAPVDATVGLTAETGLLLPFAVGFLIYADVSGTGQFGRVSWGMTVLLAAAGPVTALPLLWFTNSAKRLRLATLGFLQYLAPTGHFLLALAFGEHASTSDWISFACVWPALVIFSVDSTRRNRKPTEALRRLP